MTNHAICMALRMAMWVCQSVIEVVSPPQNSISVTFCTDIYKAQLVNPDGVFTNSNQLILHTRPLSLSLVS